MPQSPGSLMPVRNLLPLVLLVSFLACGGGSGGTGTQASSLAAPKHLTVSPGDTPLDITLQWDSVPGPEGYNLEARTGSGPFSKLNSSLIPPSATAIYITFNSNAPEATDFGFRMDSVKGSARSPYSNIATYHLGVFAPGQPSGIYDLARGGVTLSWTRNTLSGNGLAIDRAPCDLIGNITGSWVSLPVTDPLASSYLDTTAPLGSYYAYRITNLKNGESSPGSPASYSIYAGFEAPPSMGATAEPGSTLVDLGWPASDQSADGARIERSPADDNGAPTGNWTLIGTVSGSATTFVDSTAAEGSMYCYRASYTYGAQVSPATESDAVLTPLFPPTALQATPIAGGFHLSWQNHSQATTQILITRSPNGTPFASLAPGTTSFDDLTIPGLGYYTYQVTASNPLEQASSPFVTAMTPAPPGSLALTSTALTAPAGDAASRPNGAWAFDSWQPFSILSNYASWPANTPAGFVAASPIQVDAFDHPHVVYLATDPSDATQRDLTHLWFDGAAWQSEVMGKSQVVQTYVIPGFTFTLGPDGSPQCLLDTTSSAYPNGGSTSTLTYIHKSGGVWTTDSLATLSPSIPYIGSYRIRTDASGVPYLLMGNGNSVLEYTQDVPGHWVSSTIPTGNVESGSFNFLDACYQDASNETVFFERDQPADPFPILPMVIQKVNGAWLPPVALGSPDAYGSGNYDGAALSFDRTRLAAFRSTPAGLRVYHQDTGGVWHETLAAPAQRSGSFVHIGLDGSNKIHVSIGPSGLSTAWVDLHE